MSVWYNEDMKYLDDARVQIMSSLKSNNCCLYAFLSALVITSTNQFDGRMLELKFIDNGSYLYVKDALSNI